MKRKSDPHSILGVSKFATMNEITHAYRKLASALHPDKGGDPEKFMRVHEAYNTLKTLPEKQGIINMEIISTPKELVSLLGEKVVLSYKDIEFEIVIPYTTRVGDTIKVHNIIENIDLSVKIKDRYEQ